MDEKIKFLKIRPDTSFPFLYVPFNKEAIWDGAIAEGEVGETWEIVIVEMTEAQYKNLPEFQGW